MTTETVDKISAAKRQTNAAIRLLFAREDPLACLSLSSAAWQVLRDLAQVQECQWHQEFERMIRPEKRNLFWRTVNGPYNFMKHADRDPDANIEISDLNVDLTLISCVQYYRSLTGQVTMEMRVFLSWFIILYPDILENEVLSAEMGRDPVFSSIRNQERSESLTLGAVILQRKLQERQ